MWKLKNTKEAPVVDSTSQAQSKNGPSMVKNSLSIVQS